jgi:predicted DNA-binding protein
MPGGTLSKRVNMRVAADTYDAYDKVATFFNRSVADLMREALDTGAPTMEALGVMIDRAKAGDKQAVDELFDKLVNMQQGTLDLAREVNASQQLTDAEQHNQSAGASNTAL